jgi:hypothetical protein
LRSLELSAKIGKQGKLNEKSCRFVKKNNWTLLSSDVASQASPSFSWRKCRRAVKQQKNTWTNNFIVLRCQVEGILGFEFWEVWNIIWGLRLMGVWIILQCSLNSLDSVSGSKVIGKSTTFHWPCFQ